MIPLLILRHGKTSWNLQKKLQGRQDIPLCDEGREALRAVRLPEEFQDYQWICSPLQRAVETAQLLGGENIQQVPDIIEMDFGQWEGFTIKQLRARYGDAMIENEARGQHMRPKEGETPAEVQARLIPFLKTLKKPTIAVTHKGVIRALKSLAYNWDMTDKAPVEFNWQAAHLFQIDTAGYPHPDRVNIELEKR